MDFLSTKGIEYLLSLSYLLLLIPFWWLLRRVAEERVPAPAMSAMENRQGWFTVPDGLHFHRGHTWVKPEGNGLFRVGIDDFARRLLGRPSGMSLPVAGDRLQQGEKGWSLEVDGHDVDMLSPLPGQVEEVNQEALRSPGLVSDDPFGDGWLMKVRAQPGALRNLLPTRLVRTWMDDTSKRLSTLSGGELGPVLQDGGVPLFGFARQLAGDNWPEIAAELLLTTEESSD